MAINIFFTVAEISFISSSTLRLRHRREKGNKAAGRACRLLQKPERFLATALIGMNITIVLATSFITYFFIESGITQNYFWITAFFTPIVVIFAEMIPKNVGRYFKEDFICWASGPMLFFETVFMPFIVLFERVSRWLVRRIIGKVKERSPFVTKQEIKSLINEVERGGGIDRGEKEAIEEVFQFRESRVKDVCLRLKSIVGIDYTDSSEVILKIIQEKGFTRYPVFNNKEIVGYLNIYDLFYNPKQDWHSLVRPITRVGVNQKLYEVFAILNSKKESIALVFKGKRVYGMVTVQDSIREIITSIIKM